MRTWILPGVYLAAAVVFAAVVATANMHTSGSWLFRYIVEGDAHRFLGARVLALFVLLGGVASVVRTSMRGVIVHPDGIETRSVVNFGWPRVKNCTWAEIDEFVFEQDAIALGLWHGERLWLPPVLDERGLRRALEKVAAARAIPMHGPAARSVDNVDLDEEDES